MFPFATEWKNLRNSCNQQSSLPGNVTLLHIAEANIDEIVWKIATSSTQEDRMSLISDYFQFPLMFDESDVVLVHIPVLVARMVVLDSVSTNHIAFKFASDYLFSLFSDITIRSTLDDNIFQVFWEILSYLIEFSGEYEKFKEVVALFFSKFMKSSIDLSKWLSTKSGRLLELIMFIVSKFTFENQATYSIIWCNTINCLISCQDYWENSIDKSYKDVIISFLIIRHLKLIELYGNYCDNFLDLLLVLKELILFANRIITESNLDIHIFWYQKTIYLISEYWDKFEKYSTVIDEILSSLFSSQIHNHSLLDGFVFFVSGFRYSSVVLSLNHIIDPITSIENVLISYEKFGLSILENKTKSFSFLSNYLYSLMEVDERKSSIGDLLQRLNDILHLYLQTSKLNSLFALDNRTSYAIVSCLMYLKFLLPQYEISLSCQLSPIEKCNSNLMIFDQMDLVSNILQHCLYSFGIDCWSCFQSLRSIYKSVDLSGNNFMSTLMSLFNTNKLNHVDFIKYEFSSIICHLKSTQFLNSSQWNCQLARMLAVRSSKIVYSHCHPDIFSLPSISLNCLPKIFATVEFSSEESVKLVNAINEILHFSDFNDKKIVLVNCIIKKLEYIENESCHIYWGNIDLYKAADIAYCAEMYTASLFLLEKLWLKDNYTHMSKGIIGLYEKSFKVLGCQEELFADKFINDSAEFHHDNHCLWFLKNGKFDLLRKLISADFESEFLSFKGSDKLEILWRLSRWGDEEKFEVNSLNSDNASRLAMYDFLYCRTSFVSQSYENYVADICRNAWDQEACVTPLIECATINSYDKSIPTILDSLIFIANKSNVNLLDSSIVWSLIKSNKLTNNVEMINRYSLSISDLAIGCKKPEYIHIIRDMINAHNIDETIVKCNGESSFLRMIDATSHADKEGEMRKSYVKLEQLIYDLQDHLSKCPHDRNGHSLLFKLYFTGISKICSWNQDYPVHSVSYIRTKILEPALIFENIPSQDCDLLSTMSMFSYQQYTQINQYMNSSEYENRLKFLMESKRDASFLEDLGDKSRHRRILEKQSMVDSDDLKILSQDKDNFLLSAAIGFSECLQKEARHSFKVFHLMSMWLNNESNEKLNDIVSGAIDKVASYKFLVLIPQLCARLNSNNHKSFETNLEKLIEKIISDHPYHSIYNLLAIRNANRDSEFINTKIQIKSRGVRESLDKMNSRINLARKIIEKLLKTFRGPIVKDAERLTTAYIQWANTDVSHFKLHCFQNLKMPASCPLLSVAKTINLPDPTISIPIDTSCKYSSNKLLKIVGFDNVFSLQGGINLPKVVWCQSSDGLKRRQLVKSRDDLRQDSVMQQVFSVVNSLLGNTNLTSSNRSMKNIASYTDIANRNISIRTYKVIPTSQTSGLIEWCAGTIPLGDWLTKDKTGAHQRYRPKDYTPIQCRKILCNSLNKSIKERVEIFQEILEKIKPVLGYFLLENFPGSQRWFRAKKSYAHSLAINSIVGFILGLGDRHVQNILLDLNTAEFIHIDFGIAFDQGKLLPSQERVPFRLTRDLVHALGPFGVEGRFKTTCCSVLKLLRAQKDIILTLIEVLLHDPLHTWTLDFQQTQLLQAKRVANNNNNSKSFIDPDGENKKSANQNQNQMAERVILEMSRKFAGAVDSSYLNPEGHVNYLIQTATDIEILSRMFYGWQAYL